MCKLPFPPGHSHTAIPSWEGRGETGEKSGPLDARADRIGRASGQSMDQVWFCGAIGRGRTRQSEGLLVRLGISHPFVSIVFSCLLSSWMTSQVDILGILEKRKEKQNKRRLQSYFTTTFPTGFTASYLDSLNRQHPVPLHAGIVCRRAVRLLAGTQNRSSRPSVN